MATITLVASGNTGLTGMTISDSYPITNAYEDSSDTSSYARYSISTSTTGYVYLTYDTSDIPPTATIQSVEAKARLRISNTSRVTNRVCQLYTGTTTKGSNTDYSSTSSGGAVITLSTGTSWTRSELNDLRMRIGGTGSSSTSSKYIYIYGTDITITYTTASRTVTTTLTGSGTIDPSGTQTMYDGDEYSLIIEPTNSSDEVAATKNGTSITLTKHVGGATEETNVLGDYTLVSGSFNGSGASYFQGLVGKGHDNTQTTSNYYSGGSSTIAVFTYDVHFEEIPDNATITSLYMLVNGHAESTSQSSEYMCARLISGSTNLSDELNFKSVGTSNSTQTVTANVTPTIEQLENLKVQCRLGYYGGAINGATVYLEYEVSGVWYTYSTTVDSDMTIAVTIGGGGSSPKIYIKESGSQAQIDQIYISDESLSYNSTDQRYHCTKSIDLSSFSIGDTCEINGTVFQYDAGSAVAGTTQDIGYSFTWTGNDYTYTSGIYKIKINSSTFDISVSSAQGSLYGNGSHYITFYKSTGGWTEYSKVYKKVNGSWVEQASSTWATLFNTNTNYRKME